jgi:hypothetical protein
VGRPAHRNPPETGKDPAQQAETVFCEHIAARSSAPIDTPPPPAPTPHNCT